MKIKKMIIVVCCMILSAFILGATGILKITNEAAQESPESPRLIGVLITREYLDLFDSDRFFSDHAERLAAGGEISGPESAEYQGRLYASLAETIHTNEETGETITGKEYIFNDVDGIRFFAPYIRDESESYQSTNIDEGITDAQCHFQSTDDGESVSLKGTIFIAANASNESYAANASRTSNSSNASAQKWEGNLAPFYFNPVYQTADGEVYAVAGNGIFWSNEETSGASWSTKITENQEVTLNGMNTSSGSEVEVTVCVMEEPTDIALLQFDGNHEVLTRTEYQPGTLPKRLDILSDTQYIMMETSSPEGLNRILFQKEDNFAYAFYCRDDGICIKQESEIGWTN